MGFMCLEALAFFNFFGGGKKGVGRNRTKSTVLIKRWRRTTHLPPQNSHLFCFMWEDLFAGFFCHFTFNQTLLFFFLVVSSLSGETYFQAPSHPIGGRQTLAGCGQEASSLHHVGFSIGLLSVFTLWPLATPRVIRESTRAQDRNCSLL